jgi:threonine/homoserine/homoserine lactone efflux protein
MGSVHFAAVKAAAFSVLLTSGAVLSFIFAQAAAQNRADTPAHLIGWLVGNWWPLLFSLIVNPGLVVRFVQGYRNALKNALGATPPPPDTQPKGP